MKEDRPAKSASAFSAVAEAFISNQSALKRFVARYVYRSQDVDDLTQEAFLRAYQAEQGKTSTIEHPKAFLFKVARNLALEGLRNKSSQIADQIAEFSEESIKESVGTMEDSMEAREYLGAFCEAAAILPPRCRQVYLLRKVYGFSYKEIAAKLGITVSTAEKHMRVGVLKTSAYLREHSDFDQQRAQRRQAAEIKEGAS